jgi:hypothetical protein
MAGAELGEEWPKGRPVLAEAAELLGGEGGEEELADGSYVCGLCVVGHGVCLSVLSPKGDQVADGTDDDACLNESGGDDDHLNQGKT